MGIKTLWFDLGNVLLHFSFEPAFRKLARFTPLEVNEIRRYFGSHPALEADVDEGRVHERSLYKRLVRDLKLTGLSFKRFKEIWNNIFKENRPVVKLIRTLRRRGYRLVLISNTNRMHYEYIRRRYTFLGNFHRHILSYRVGARKPKRKIYERALAVSGALKNEIFYTDDRIDLTDAAFFNHGIHTHTYVNVRNLKEDMRRLGVRID